MATLTYSENAQLNRYLFFKNVNDINIFVEDADKEYEYETVFKKIFKDDFNISTIYAVGGKRNVEIAFESFGPIYENAKNIYIVDGDFDRVLRDTQLISNPHYIYLENYNIENYYIDKSAVISFMKGKLRKLDDEVKQIVKFDNWLNTIVEQFTPIFILYAIIQNEKLGLSNVGKNEYEKVNKDNGFVIDGLYESIHQEVSSHLDNLHQLELDMKKTYNDIFGTNYFNLICGKHLKVSLWYYLKSIQPSVKFKDLEWSLISNLNQSNFEDLKSQVLDLCK